MDDVMEWQEHEDERKAIGNNAAPSTTTAHHTDNIHL